ncbi:DUF3330 domain-containing protein [Acinetobacter portensis]|uniref:DUF3330 domain-containing protein n=1 Tax=Acinetobacter portensis TaxID=1839785 RepID=A0ABY4JZJ6_9GAMM|nr:DUF3330 domain-containing protein [Acinetobacter portensis]MCK7609879.1 DUF3330 domain-containing protein [Acinetobacter portensis]MCK7640654.1 DUF3330 domain-containing protein [Acinetobacter portensis]UPO24835.1 DUF3330 domain-containing protein [Acinetobacter portensis]
MRIERILRYDNNKALYECQKSISLDIALTDEGGEYLLNSCGLECYQFFFQNQAEQKNNMSIKIQNTFLRIRKIANDEYFSLSA